MTFRGPAISRRLLLAGASAAVPMSLVSSCAPAVAPPLPVDTASTGIDVHCHVFNARDLPIPGFVLHVVLERYQAADVALGPLVTFLSLLVDLGARGADAEIASLDDGTERPFSLASGSQVPGGPMTLFEKARVAALSMQTGRMDARSAEIARQAEAVVAAASRSTLTTSSAAPIQPFSLPDGGLRADPGNAGFLRRLSELTPDGPLPRGPGASPSFLAPRQAPGTGPDRLAASPELLATAAARGIVRHAQNRSGVFYLADLVTKPRNELVRDVAKLPLEADRGSISLFTPALIDFSYWLDYRAGVSDDPTPTASPADVTPLSRQVAVMSRIVGIKRDAAGAARPYAVHPFVSFCPWREVAEQRGGIPEGERQSAVVKDAIRNKGFIGIKLYPVMGFRPTGNAGQPPSIYPSRLRQLSDWAEGMDEALEALYSFCIDEDVPVMAHCSYSQYPSPGAGKLGSPDGWWEVLDRHPRLRLNLAHCGGVWDLARDKAAKLARDIPIPWPVMILERLGSAPYPNLYADLADFDDVLACPGPGAPACGGQTAPAAATALAQLVACHPAARRRLMYGTDYMFLIQAAGTEWYLSQMRDCLAPALGMVKEDLMGGNAARFLGLVDPSSGSRRRLDKFRGDKFLARWERHA